MIFFVIKMPISDFIATKPDAEELRIRHPGLKELLSGEFKKDTPNLYPQDNPVVASWELDRGQDKNPTYGMFAQQEEPHVFETGQYIETLIILSGRFKTENEQKISVGGHVMVTAEDVLKLTALSDVTYLCLYQQKYDRVG
jgi:hypothetical protein